jgi:hypothetical protein
MPRLGLGCPVEAAWAECGQPSAERIRTDCGTDGVSLLQLVDVYRTCIREYVAALPMDDTGPAPRLAGGCLSNGLADATRACREAGADAFRAVLRAILRPIATEPGAAQEPKAETTAAEAAAEGHVNTVLTCLDDVSRVPVRVKLRCERVVGGINVHAVLALCMEFLTVLAHPSVTAHWPKTR